MKKIIFITIIFGLFSCTSDEKDIEILQNNDAIYFTEAKVDNRAQPLGDNEYFKLNDELKKMIMEIHGDQNGKVIFYPIAYRIYIGKDGNVDKIMNLTSYITGFIMGRYIDNNSKLSQSNIYSNQEVITQKLIPIFRKTKFTPAKLEGNPVPFQTDLKSFAVVNEKQEISLEFDWNLSINLNIGRNPNLKKDEYVVASEEMPSPIGGIKAIQEKIIYPEIAKRAGIQGRVYIKAFIDENGDVTETEIIKGLDGGCSEIAAAAVKNTKFEPGRQKGKPVKVQVTVPIMFKLQ